MISVNARDCRRVCVQANTLVSVSDQHERYEDGQRLLLDESFVLDIRNGMEFHFKLRWRLVSICPPINRCALKFFCELITVRAGSWVGVLKVFKIQPGRLVWLDPLDENVPAVPVRDPKTGGENVIWSFVEYDRRKRIANREFRLPPSFPHLSCEVRNCYGSANECSPTTQGADPFAQAVLFADDAPLCIEHGKIRPGHQRNSTEQPRRDERDDCAWMRFFPHGGSDSTRSLGLARAA